MIVVDASYAVEASFTPGGFDRLRRHEAVAPSLLWSECRSTLHEMAWRGAISATLAAAAHDALQRAPIARQDDPGLGGHARQIATRLGWAKTYDAEYVALARILGCPLLTVDGRLARGAAGEVRMLTPSEL